MLGWLQRFLRLMKGSGAGGAGAFQEVRCSFDTAEVRNAAIFDVFHDLNDTTSNFIRINGVIFASARMVAVLPEGETGVVIHLATDKN